jgi:nitrite reductase/ring-hydroxylating ferredoxin subunit/uncharacterized membrane protein
MKSTAHVKGHSLHPILVIFPIASFVGTLVFDVLGWINSNYSFHATAYYLNITGLATALLAAVPGLIDFIYTVPPDSTANKRGARHAIINIVVLILFGIALGYRLESAQPSMPLLAGLEAIAVGLLMVSGWMGGTLVSRNQIGMNHRYAEAGKWKEEYLAAENGQVELRGLDELKPNQMKLLHVDAQRIVIARTEQKYVAFSDHCTHRGGSLAGGVMICGTVQCPWHGSQFDVQSGEVKAGPAEKKIVTYRLSEKEGKIYLMLDNG